MNFTLASSRRSQSTQDLNAQFYQSIGELVIAIQWVESSYRELGWFIEDPERSVWPPRGLRRESLGQLIDIVTDMFLKLVCASSFPNGDEFAKTAVSVRNSLSQFRSYRNQVLHSAFVELKAGGDVVGYLRTDVKRGVDPNTGEMIGTLEDISSASIQAKLATYGDAFSHLEMMYKQVIYWYGLDDGARWRSGRAAA